MAGSFLVHFQDPTESLPLPRRWLPPTLWTEGTEPHALNPRLKKWAGCLDFDGSPFPNTHPNTIPYLVPILNVTKECKDPWIQPRCTGVIRIRMRKSLMAILWMVVNKRTLIWILLFFIVSVTILYLWKICIKYSGRRSSSADHSFVLSRESTSRMPMVSRRISAQTRVLLFQNFRVPQNCAQNPGAEPFSIKKHHRRTNFDSRKALLQLPVERQTVTETPP